MARDAVTTCKGEGCGAIIRWVITEAGRQMPVNLGPHPDGTVVPALDPRTGERLHRFGVPVVRVLTGAELPAQEPALRPHWATCPASPQFRRRRARMVARCVACKDVLDPVLVRQGLIYHPTCEPAEDLPVVQPDPIPGMPADPRRRPAPEQDPPEPRGCRA